MIKIRLRIGAIRVMTLTTILAGSAAQEVRRGDLPVQWITGGPKCVEVPDWQIQEYNEDLYILRESGCTH